MDASKTSQMMGLPGFRFHPTEEELLDFYLKNTILGKKKLHYDIIGLVNIYRHDPWYLPGLAKIGEREWYFFVPRDTKHGNGGRPNRTTEHGFWKATGSDRKIVSLSDPKRVIGLKKTLVFYLGRAPRGTKTDWVMNEYRLPDSCPPSHKDIVLCKIYRKATSLKVLEQRAAMEEEMKTTTTNTNTTPPPSPLTPPISMHTVSFCSPNEDSTAAAAAASLPVLKKEEEEEPMITEEENFLNDEAAKCLNLQLPTGMDKLELQLPKFGSQDPFYAPLCSPWLDNWLIPYANVLGL